MRLAGLGFTHSSGFTLGPIDVEGPDDRPWLILGPAGSGKTTLLRLLGGAIQPHRGELGGFPPRTRRAYLPQLPERALAGRNLGEDLTGSARPDCAKRRRAREALRSAGLSGISLSRHRTTLSAGQRRLVTLGLVFSRDFEAMALDEPDAGLDRRGISELRSLLGGQVGALHRACWIATHRFDVYRGFEAFVLVLDRGRLLAYGAAQNVLCRKDVVDVLSLDKSPRFRFWNQLRKHRANLPENVYETLRNFEPSIAQVQEILTDTAAAP